MDILFNNYEIIQKIGKGGTSNVYLARNVSSGELLAIKEVNKDKGNNIDLLAEPSILKRLDNPALPKIADIREDENNVYIIEDYIEGVPLDKQLKRVGKFEENLVLNWAKQLCHVLLYLHNQKPNPIIYRDMKPGNIIISPDNTVKLIDFGTAREFKVTSTTDTMYIGTRGYAAPEQYGGSQSDARTDIYSLGITLYHLLTGKAPNDVLYNFKPIRILDDMLSEEIESIVDKCVQNDPADRYQSVDELLADLESIGKADNQLKKKEPKKDLDKEQKKLKKEKVKQDGKKDNDNIKKQKKSIPNIAKISLLCIFVGMIFIGINFIRQGDLSDKNMEIYEEYLQSELIPKYKIMRSKKVLYTTGSEKKHIFNNPHNGIASVEYLDLDGNDIDEMLVTIVKDTGILVEAYTLDKGEVVSISVDKGVLKSALNDSWFGFDRDHGIDLSNKNQINRMGVFDTEHAYSSLNLFVKELNDNKKYLCIEFTQGWDKDGDSHNKYISHEYIYYNTYLEIYELKNGKLSLLHEYNMVGSSYDKYWLIDNAFEIAEYNYKDNDSELFVDQVREKLDEYGLSGLYYTMDYSINGKKFTKASKREENIIDIISLHCDKNRLDESNNECWYDRGVVYIESTFKEDIYEDSF